MTSNPTQIVIIAFGLLFVITNTLALGLRLQIGQMLTDFFQNWKLAAWVITDQFRHPPSTDHRLRRTRSHSLGHQDRVLYRRAGGGCAIRSHAHPLSQGQRRNVHNSVCGLGRGDHHRRASRAVSYRLCCGSRGAVHPDLGCRLAASPLHTPTPVHRVSIRLRYPDAAVNGARPLQIIAIACLLVYTNIFIVSDWSLFVNAWESGAYIASFAVPILGIAFGSIISWKNVENRHASVITTAQRSISGAIIVTIYNYPQPLANVSVTIINSCGIIILLLLSLEWGRAQAQKGAVADTSVVTEQVS